MTVRSVTYRTVTAITHPSPRQCSEEVKIGIRLKYLNHSLLRGKDESNDQNKDYGQSPVDNVTYKLLVPELVDSDEQAE
jgi:hypothetical protein